MGVNADAGTALPFAEAKVRFAAVNEFAMPNFESVLPHVSKTMSRSRLPRSCPTRPSNWQGKPVMQV
jgi:hypothetical protein